VASLGNSMTPDEEAFLDAHEAMHYVWALHELNYYATGDDIIDLVIIAKRLRKRNMTGPIASYVILAELDAFREERVRRISLFNKAVEFITNAWRMDTIPEPEQLYEDMTAEEAYTKLMNIKQS
jgi:hypothetical protein